VKAHQCTEETAKRCEVTEGKDQGNELGVLYIASGWGFIARKKARK
jgi:hypothetical protein